MADVIGPFDGTVWTQDAWYRHAPKWAPSGVNGSPATSISSGDLPFSNSGLSVGAGNGRAWVRGAGFERVDGPALLAVSANTNASLSRRDRLVLRRDLTAKTLTPVVLLGTPSASPAAPALTRVETGQWDIPLFSWLTPPSSGTNLTSITDERGWIRASNPINAFASAAARDANLPTPSDGDPCTVSGVPQIYRSSDSLWHGQGTLATYLPTFAAQSGVSDNISHAIYSVTVTDPGVPYRLRTFGSVEINSPTGTRVDTSVQVGSDTFDGWVGDVSYFHKHAGESPNSYTGAQTVSLTGTRLSGSGSWSTTGLNTYFIVEVVGA